MKIECRKVIDIDDSLLESLVDQVARIVEENYYCHTTYASMATGGQGDSVEKIKAVIMEQLRAEEADLKNV